MNKLVKLSRSTIPAFVELYNGVPKHAAITAMLKKLLIQTKEFPEFNDKVELLSLNGDWERDGLFLLKTNQICYFNSLEAAPYNRVKKALNLIDYNDEVIFPLINDKFKEAVSEVANERNLEAVTDIEAVGYSVGKSYIQGLKTPT